MVTGRPALGRRLARNANAFLIKQAALAKKVFPFNDLPRDIQQDIMVIYLTNEIDQLPAEPASLPLAAEKVRTLTLINKAFNDVVNESTFTLKLIKQFAARFKTSDGAVAKALATRGAQERNQLQEKFSDSFSSRKSFSKARFEKYCNEGIDLEWTYSCGDTALKHAAMDNKLALLKALIAKKG